MIWRTLLLVNPSLLLAQIRVQVFHEICSNFQNNAFKNKDISNWMVRHYMFVIQDEMKTETNINKA